MSATRSNMSLAGWRTCRRVENCGIPLALRGARRLQPREVLAGVVRRAGQRRGRHHQETLGVGDRLQRLELVRRHEALDRGMLARRLQVLADGEEVDS